ncbi:MAG: hypothetical protein PVJ38_06610 [Candidatus Bathyarchaeota archaeon]
MTVNEGHRDWEELVEIIWGALDYFQEGIWEEVKFLGNVSLEHDMEVSSNEGVHGAFNLGNLMNKLRMLKTSMRAEELLLALTQDPVILVYHRFVTDGFRRIINLVQDYVAENVGLVSLFKIDKETSIKVTAHGLGHNQGLTHHLDPVGLMYIVY